ncbi:MAG: dienelactone hydrolase family protein [Methylobacteriaceae bacterium]|nr:dienelactone hydrolase family protein [Methylobacteriaceae bacterium]
MTSVTKIETPGVRGFLHAPEGRSGRGLVLTHGAGGNCNAPMLVEVARQFSAAGVWVLRCDLPFRQRRASGLPSPATGAGDRAGLRAAVETLRETAHGSIYLGGHSYGGRQATMLAADEPDVAAGLLLFSYPLHPPGKPEQLRTAHFPRLRIPAVFVHGTRDSFGTLEELQLAITAIPGPTRIIPVEGAGHDLRRGRFDLGSVVAALLR